MTDTSAPRLDWAGIIRREWWIIAIAAVVGLAVAFATADRAVTQSYVATLRVTAPGSVGSVVTPRAESVVVAASVPSVLRSAEASGGMPAGSLTGRAGAKIDAADKTSAILTLRADSEDAARKEMDAYSKAVKVYIFRPQATYIDVQRRAVEELTLREKALSTRADALEAEAARLPLAQRGLYVQAIQAVRSQQYGARDIARAAEQNQLTVQNSVSFDPLVSVSKRSSGGLELSNLLQGLLLGIALGVAIAWIREWLRARSASAA